MADEKTTTTEAPKIDPYVERITKSMGMVLEPEAPKVEDKPLGPKITLGEAAVMADEKAKAAAANPPVVEPKVEPAKEPAKEPAAEPKRLTLRKKEPTPEPVKEPEKPTVEAPPAQTPAELSEADYIKGLTPEQQEELAVAQFADKQKPGIRAKTLEYFREVDKFLADNPDGESEELDKFIKDHKPKWGDAERRRIEREMIVEQTRETVKAEVLKEVEPAVREQKKKLLAIESKPQIDEAVEVVGSEMTLVRTEEGAPAAIDQDVVKVIQEKGYDEAVKQFRVEAPIVQGTIQASRAWMELSTGVATFDDANPMHRFLIEFIGREGQNMKRLPKEQTERDGRSFMPMNELMALRQKDQAEASKYYTFDDQMILEMLATNARHAVASEIKSLESAGFKRESKKVLAQTDKQSETGTTKEQSGAGQTGGSPRAGSRGLPGASDSGGVTNPNAAFLDQLFPGASKIAGS